jgi:hypothetical protein
MSAANVSNLLMIVIEKDISIVYYTVIGVSLMEMLMIMFKLYRLIMKRKRLSNQIHPTISLKPIDIHSRDTLEPPMQPGKEADMSPTSPHREQDVTELQLEVVPKKPRRRRSLVATLKKQLSDSIFNISNSPVN